MKQTHLKGNRLLIFFFSIGYVEKRFYGGDSASRDEDPWLFMNECSRAYKNFFCYANFPRCDEFLNSLPLCVSVCENYFYNCGYSQEMYRCGPSVWANGYEPEKPTFDEDGKPTFLRSFMPGQPFIKNLFNDDGDPLAVCTPSLISPANSLRKRNIILLVFGFLLLFGFVFLYIV